MTEVARDDAPLDDEVIALASLFAPLRHRTCSIEILLSTNCDLDRSALPSPHGDANRNVATWFM